ncbi:MULTISPECIES: hypothetical protein [unclassified Streptomyces]
MHARASWSLKHPRTPHWIHNPELTGMSEPALDEVIDQLAL